MLLSSAGHCSLFIANYLQTLHIYTFGVYLIYRLRRAIYLNEGILAKG